MKGHVGVAHPVDVALYNAVLERVRQRGKLAQGVVIHNVGADGGRLALYRGAYSIQAYHVVQVQLQYEAAGLAGVLHDEAYLRQLADGLRHRSARNAKRGRDLVDVQLRAGVYLEIDYIVIQKLCHKVAQLCIRVLVHYLLESKLLHKCRSSEEKSVA